MNIISGQNVDLITPFPSSEAARTFGWKHCYRTLAEDDDAPIEREAFIECMEGYLSQYLTFGIIDKGQLTSAKHEAPLVGIVLAGPLGGRDISINFAAGRKAFKMGLVEEALSVAIPVLLTEHPELLRISATLDESNVPAKGVFKRLGFRFEGVTQDAVLQSGVPRARVQFGLTRARFVEIWYPPIPPTEHIEVPATPEEVNAIGITTE